MSNFDVTAPVSFKTSTPDWVADLEQSMLDELATRTHEHTPALVDCVGDTRYAICVTCDQNVESWWFDGDDDRLSGWTSWGIRVEFANGATLEKICKM